MASGSLILRRLLSRTGNWKGVRLLTTGLPENEPMTDFTNPDVKARLTEALDQVRSQIEDIPIVIGGQEFRTDDVQYQQIPFNHQQKIAKYHYANKELIEKAIENALINREKWDKTPYEQRAPIFLRAADLIATKYRYLSLACTMLGQAKTAVQADMDCIGEIIDFLRFNVHYAEEIYEGPPLHQPQTMINRVVYRGLEGFIASISPFNFSAIGGNLSSSPAMVGNVVLWKPSDTAMLSGWLLYKIFRESGLPDGVIQFVPADGPVFGDVITSSPDLAGISFTGSAKTFKHLWKQVAQNLDNYKTFPRLVGECGGKNYHFVHESADIDTVVNSTMRSSFEFGGQKCSACSRLYVPDTMWPELKEKFVENMKTIKLGSAEDYSNYLSAVIDDKSFSKIKSYIDHAKSSPNTKVIAGGNCDDSVGYYVEPTLVETTDPKEKIMQEEIFGPVVTAYVYPAKEYRETLKLMSSFWLKPWIQLGNLFRYKPRQVIGVNSTSSYGLTGSVFSKDRDVIIEACDILRQSAGNFYINDKSTGSVVGQQPFGGARASGTNDKAGVATYLLKWMSPQSVKETLVPIEDWRYEYMQQ